MRINNNITAMNSHRMYGINAGRLGQNIERLSSGFRVNRAADDAAGLAISEQMRTQIRGLRQASRNAQDGISLVQTAEGAMDNAHQILQRMRELVIQAASDINDNSVVGEPLEDRGMIQAEIEQLAQEIVDIGLRTEFNGRQVLTGAAGGAGGTGAAGASAPVNPFDAVKQGVLHAAWDAGRGHLDAGTNTYISDVMDQQAVVATKTGLLNTAQANLDKGIANAANLRDVLSNLTSLLDEITGGDITTKDAAVARINEYLLGATKETGAAFTPVTGTGAGTVADLIAIINPAIAAVGAAIGAQDNAVATTLADAVTTARDELVEEQLALADYVTALNEALDSISARTEFNNSDVTVEQLEALGFTRAQWEAAFMSGARAEVAYIVGQTGVGAPRAEGFLIQVGANARQLISLELPDLIGSMMDAGIINEPGTRDSNENIAWSDTRLASAINVDIENVADITDFVENLDDAIAQVSEARAILGAQQNRMEFKIAGLDNTAENLQAAESRIRDTDMAAAMTEFTRNNIMFQASTAMLAQANAMPQAVLQLLG